MRKTALLLIISLLVFTPLFPVRADLGVKVEVSSTPWEEIATSFLQAMNSQYYHQPPNEFSVGVLDDGFDYSLPIFENRKWIDETGEYPNPGADFVAPDKDPKSANVHGTAVASIIARMTPSNIKIAGLLVFNKQSRPSAVISAIKFAIKHNIKVLNISMAFNDSLAASAQIREALDSYCEFGGLIIVAAGNEGNNNDEIPRYPASYSHDCIISVAALDGQDNLAKFSNYGKEKVDVGAPGISITVQTKKNSTEQWGGTSFSAPIVSALVAYIWSIKPSLNAQEVKKIIMETSDICDSLCEKMQAGKINFINAFKTVIGEIESESICYKGKIIVKQELINGWQKVILNDMPDILLQDKVTWEIKGDEAMQIAKSKIDYWYDKKMLNTECGCSQ